MNVEYIDHMGTDLSVVNAARVSFAKESSFNHYCDYSDDDLHFELKEKDNRLIKFLAKHRHELPFAHTAITLRMTAPIPIARQCFKHKVGFVENEESRRYITETPKVYIPDTFRSKPEGSIKQGSGGPHPSSEDWRDDYIFFVGEAVKTYEHMIADGVCPEQARFVLPQGTEVTWIWTGSLLAYLRFYLLRSDSHAQLETQELAEMVRNVIEPLFPVSWEAWMSGPDPVKI